MAIITIFVSSTFLDFNAERDELAGPIRDELNAMVRPLGHQVEVVDLRWGIDTADVAELDVEDLVLSSCAGAIQQSSVFLGLIGDRPGWRPRGEALEHALSSLDAPVETIRQLRERLLGAGGLSVTGFEFWLAQELADGPPTAFIRRSHQSGGDDTAHGLPVSSVADGSIRTYVEEFDGDRAAFRAAVLETLTPLVRSVASASGEGQRHPHELAAEWYWAALDRSFVGREALVDQICGQLRNGVRVVLHGEPGVGVSAVWIHVVERLRRDGELVWSAIAGLTPQTSTPAGMAQRLLDELGVEQARDEPDAALVVAAREQPRVVVAIDEGESLRSWDGRDRLAIVRRLMDGSDVIALASVHDAAALDFPARFRRTSIEVPPLDGHSVARTIRDHLYPKSLPDAAERHLASVPRAALWARLAALALDQIEPDEIAAAQLADNPATALRDAIIARAWTLPEALDDLVDAVVGNMIARIVRRHPDSSPEVLWTLVAALAIAPDGLDPDELRSLAAGDPAIVRPLLSALSDFLQPTDAWGAVRIGSHTVRGALSRSPHTDLREAHARLASLIEWSAPGHRHRRWLLHHAVRALRADLVDRALSAADVDDEEVVRWLGGQLMEVDVPLELLRGLGNHVADHSRVFAVLRAAYWLDLRYRSPSIYGERVDAVVDRVAWAVGSRTSGQDVADVIVVEVDWLARRGRWEELRQRLTSAPASALSELGEMPGGPALLNRLRQADNRLRLHDGRFLRAVSGQLTQNFVDGFTGSDPELDAQILDDVLESHFLMATALEPSGRLKLAMSAAKAAIDAMTPEFGGRARRHPVMLLSLIRGTHTIFRGLLYHREEPEMTFARLMALEPELRDDLLAPMPADVDVLRLHAEHRYLCGHAALLCGRTREGWRLVNAAWAEANELAALDPTSDDTRHLYIRTQLARSEYLRTRSDTSWCAHVATAVRGYSGMTPDSPRALEAWMLLSGHLHALVEKAKPERVSPRAWRKTTTAGGLSSHRGRWEDDISPALFDVDGLWQTLGPRPQPPGRRPARYERYVMRQIVRATSPWGLARDD